MAVMKRLSAPAHLWLLQQDRCLYDAVPDETVPLPSISHHHVNVHVCAASAERGKC